MIKRIEDFFAMGCGRCARFATPDCSARLWAAELAHLRRICLDMGLEEVVKWGHPCYMHAGRNVAILGAFRDDVRITLFHAALLPDPEGLLERQGPNTKHPDALRFRDPEMVVTREPALRALLRAAMAVAESGACAPRTTDAPDLPEELVTALDADPEMAEAFHALTLGRQRSYAIHLVSAKAAATRFARIAKVRGRILAGKGATEL